MKILDAMNRCLRLTGKGAVNDPDSGNEDAAHAKATIKRVRRDILINGYHFNRNVLDLEPNSEGKIQIAESYLRVELPVDLSFRKDSDDGQIYLWNIDRNTWHDQTVRDVKVVFDITNPDDPGDDFEHLPDDFAKWIALQAVSEFYMEKKDGVPNTAIQQMADEAAAHAINNLAPENIDEVTGFARIASAQAGIGSNRQGGRIWVNLGF